MADNLIKKIRTDKGDCQFDYTALANLPSSLKNPYAITFTGSASAKYDGSSPATVNIPTIPSWANQDSNPSYTKDESDDRYAPIESAIRPTINGNPAVCEDSVAWNFQGLKVYGKSTQDGELSPENPVPIVSAGDGGSVGIAVTGNNLFDAKTALASQIAAGVVSINKNGEVVLNGTFDLTNRRFSVTLGPGVYYTSGGFDDDRRLIWHILMPNDSGWEGKIFIEAETTFSCYISSGTYSNLTTHPMINFGESALPWEPYTGQSLAISTPNGLPGIPVTSGGNYMDSTGQQWVCDVVDFETKTKTTLLTIGNGSNLSLLAENGSTNKYNGQVFNNDVKADSNAIAMCSHAPYGYNNNDYPHYFVGGKGVNIWLPKDFDFDGEKSNLTFLAALENPITTPLSDEEITAYQTLKTYSGTTIVSTTEPVAGIEARYIVDGTKYLASVTDRIATLEASQTQIDEV